MFSMPAFDPAQILMQYICLLFSLCVHEAAHAAMSNYCGDPTARLLGRLTLDPRRHIDIFGTVLFPLISMSTGVPLLGWAKPVPVNPRNLGNMRRDQVLVALAGPASNILIALGAVFLLRIVIPLSEANVAPEAMLPLAKFLIMLMLLNAGLAVFNMLPVPPLDGHYLLRYFAPPRLKEMLDQIGPFGIIIAFVLAGPWLGTVLPPVYAALVALVTAGT